MSRNRYTIMTIQDHRAAEREWAKVHRSVTEFQNFIRSARGTPSRLHTNVRRIHKAMETIRTGMLEVVARTLPGNARSDSCWQEPETLPPAATPRPARSLTIGDHIAAARALGPSESAVHRFIAIISNRRHLPVRILDFAIRIDHLIQIVRCEMEDVQFYTLRGRGITWVNCWLGPSNYFDDDGGRDAPGKQ
jgi:hypothetical protein